MAENKRNVIWLSVFVATLLFLVYAYKGSFSKVDYLEIARQGIKKYDPPRKDYVIVIDYRKSLLEKRLYLLNMETGQTEVEARVTHAFKSGILYASSFSNAHGTLKSSYGHFITAMPYFGNHGHSLKIIGLEREINDQAETRHIVFHQASTYFPIFSEGCFATHPDINQAILSKASDGCIVIVLTTS
jgi:hypothetical protein